MVTTGVLVIFDLKDTDRASVSKINLIIRLGSESLSSQALMTLLKSSMNEAMELVISVETTAGVNAVVSGVVATGGCGGGFKNCVLVVSEERGR